MTPFLVAVLCGVLAAGIEGFFIWHYKNLYHAEQRVAKAAAAIAERDEAAYKVMVTHQEDEAKRYRQALDDANRRITEMEKIAHECQDPAAIRDRLAALGKRVSLLSGGKDPDRPYPSVDAAVPKDTSTPADPVSGKRS